MGARIVKRTAWRWVSLFMTHQSWKWDLIFYSAIVGATRPWLRQIKSFFFLIQTTNSSTATCSYLNAAPIGSRHYFEKPWLIQANCPHTHLLNDYPQIRRETGAERLQWPTGVLFMKYCRSDGKWGRGGDREATKAGSCWCFLGSKM